MLVNMEAEKLRRLPAYVFARVNQLKAKARQQGKDVIDLGMGNPDEMPAMHIIEKMQEVALDPKAHGYSTSKGISNLRRAVTQWYARRFGVDLDSETEAIAVIGSKEGISHLAMAVLDPGDLVIVPGPSYPSHFYSVALAGANLCVVPLSDEEILMRNLAEMIRKIYPRPKAVIVSYPNNPTTRTVELSFFQELARFARRTGVLVIHDFAYAEICFDGYKAPSFLQAQGAKDVGVEIYSLSKTYSMAGWRIGFVVGNRHVVAALAKLKSYYDYGIFTPLQVAGIVALNGPQDGVLENVARYQTRRDVLLSGLSRMGWHVERPKGTLYVWAPLPDSHAAMGSMDFSLMLLEKGDVACSPGVGFGDHGEGFVRFALVENEQRIAQAVRGIRKALGR